MNLIICYLLLGIGLNLILIGISSRVGLLQATLSLGALEWALAIVTWPYWLVFFVAKCVQYRRLAAVQRYGRATRPAQ